MIFVTGRKYHKDLYDIVSPTTVLSGSSSHIIHAGSISVPGYAAFPSMWSERVSHHLITIHKLVLGRNWVLRRRNDLQHEVVLLIVSESMSYSLQVFRLNRQNIALDRHRD